MVEPISRPTNAANSAPGETSEPESAAIFLPVTNDGKPEAGDAASHPVQEGLVLRVALWVLVGGTAAESILASRKQPPAA
jgi:hypothetical protein